MLLKGKVFSIFRYHSVKLLIFYIRQKSPSFNLEVSLKRWNLCSIFAINTQDGRICFIVQLEPLIQIKFILSINLMRPYPTFSAKVFRNQHLSALGLISKHCSVILLQTNVTSLARLLNEPVTSYIINNIAWCVGWTKITRSQFSEFNHFHLNCITPQLLSLSLMA